MKLHDQILIVALGLGFGRLQPAKDFLDAVDAAQDQRHRLGGDRHAIAEFAHQGFAGMGQRFQPRQAEETAGSLDGVHQTKDVVQNLGVVRFLLEPHQLIVDGVQAFTGLRQKLSQKIIHEIWPSPTRARSTHFPSVTSFYAKRLILVEQMEKNGLNKEISRPVKYRGH